MFYIANTKSKYFLVLAMILMVPYLFATTIIWDSYREEYYPSTKSGLYTIAFLVIFASLIARSEYVYKSLLGLAGVWGLTNLVPFSFSEWSQGDFSSFLTIILYVAGLGLLGKVIVDEAALPNMQIANFVERVKNSDHKIVSFVWLILAVLASIFTAWMRFQYFYQTNLFTVLSTIAIFISTISFFDFIHRFFDINSVGLKSFTSSLNDFSIDTYLTRRISSGLYALVHTVILLSTVYYVPILISNADTHFWVMLIGFPLVLPIALVGAYIVITAVRLLIEYSNALIHVAENTSRR